MRRIISLFLTITLAFTLLMSTTTYAEQNKQILVVESNQGIISVSFNGENIEFDVAPQIINERTMVPLRAIFEALGATVDWNDDTQTVTSIKDNTTISLTINNPTMYINDETVVLDSPACLVNGRTLVPVRAISEAFAIQVEWKENTTPVPIDYDVLTDNINQINDMINKGMYLEAIQECEQTIAWHNCSPDDQNTLNTLKKSANEKYNEFLNAEKEKEILSNPISAPFDTLEQMKEATSNTGKCYFVGNFYVGKDSADGIFLHWAAKNVTDKTIKYLTFTMEFYNAVGDLTAEEITKQTSKTVKVTGPIGPQESLYIKDIVGYSVDCQSIKITNLDIEYMDGTTFSGYYGYKTERYRPGVSF